MRKHPNPSYQGLRHVPGRGPYLLQDSLYARGFGVGVRHRGSAVVMQVTTNGSYTPPSIRITMARLPASLPIDLSAEVDDVAERPPYRLAPDPARYLRDESEFGFPPRQIARGLE